MLGCGCVGCEWWAVSAVFGGFFMFWSRGRGWAVGAVGVLEERKACGRWYGGGCG